jgi:hypothetical protein
VSRSKKGLSRWLGLALVVAVLAALPSREVPAAILFVLSGLGLVWVLLFAPVWCGTDTRKHESCRNNSYGLLLGCHLQQHRWQKFRMMFVSRRWQQLNKGLWTSPAAILASVSGIITIIGFVVAIVRWIAQVTGSSDLSMVVPEGWRVD